MINTSSTDQTRTSVARSLAANTRIVSSNFTATSPSVSPSVILLPTVNTDGTVAYSIHPQHTRKKLPHMKPFQILSMPTQVIESKSSGLRTAKIRQNQAILPKLSQTEITAQVPSGIMFSDTTTSGLVEMKPDIKLLTAAGDFFFFSYCVLYISIISPLPNPTPFKVYIQKNFKASYARF